LHQSVTHTLDFQQVADDGVRRCVKVGANTADIRRSCSEDHDAYHRDVLLTQQLLPVVQEISGDFFILQQDSDPVHRSRDTIKLLERETRDTRVHCTKPVAPNSPDLINPVDYKIWGKMQQRV